MKKTDNYETWRTDWRNRFLSMDHRDIIQRLPFLLMEGNRIILQYFGHSYAISCTDGFIRPLDNAPAMTLNEELNVYTLFWYTKTGAKRTHNWVPFYQLQNASPFTAAFDKGILKPLAASFNGKEQQLCHALKRMSGVSLAANHTAMEVKAFECIPIRVLFWEGDEDFPAQANLLFDESATDYNHVESIVTIASSLLHRLTVFSGITPDSRAF